MTLLQKTSGGGAASRTRSLVPIRTAVQSIVLSLSVLCATAPNGARATTISSGDIALIGFGPSSTDRFTVVTLINLDAGTAITVTDNGWLAAGGFRTTEG